MGGLQLAVAAAAAAAATAAAAWEWRRRRRDGTWVVVLRGAGASLSTAGLTRDDISVLSWNILADRFAWGMTYCPPEFLAWPHRWGLVARALAAAGADVVCLQEVDAAKLEDLQQWAAGAGYSVVAQDPAGGKPSLCATLFRADRFQLWWADAKRSRAACCALLYCDSTGATQVLYVANCHLEGHPDKGADRLVQMRNTLASASRHASDEGLPPEAVSIVVAGDFNEGPGAGVAHLLGHGYAAIPGGGGKGGGGKGGGKSGGATPLGGSVASLAALAADAPGEATQPFLLQDAYRRSPAPYTRRVPRLASTIDQLWASAHAAVTTLLHAAEPGRDAGGMPHAGAPSDHHPLGVVLRFPPAAAAIV
ncbi:hypothetical protein Rsub_05940 [Raphidocelis subcapitata]|uniref:Endonuclease/exonuclease/phosphatase domain-containing protein n=1 Tax=Raphidocelis subcapitata TaxID=307507 RepID=A0A2V0P008_9CHLO|nr:hypothetical protein Rsub_05940 [Raphidocelis subcapitata]|eukprot:GBF93208.1 hypothetical protein Rsub_05940 [Raphidocelis subcapitata]